MLFVHTDEQWDAYLSVQRQELLAVLTARGPMSLAEAARDLDTTPDGLYHHVRLLESAGLVRVVGSRRVGTRVESIYDAAANRTRLDIDPASERNSDRLIACWRIVADSIVRRLGKALAARRVRIEGPAPDTIVDTRSAWLDEQELARVQKHLAAVRRIFEENHGRRAGTFVNLAVALCPVVRTRDASDTPTARMKRLTREAGDAERAPAMPRARPMNRRPPADSA